MLVKQGLSPSVQPHITEKARIKDAFKIGKGEEPVRSSNAFSQTYGAIKVAGGCYLNLKGPVTK
jgi:hypothetical protein